MVDPGETLTQVDEALTQGSPQPMSGLFEWLRMIDTTT